MMALTFTVQENLLPGDTAVEKWAHAERLGFAGIELRGGAGMRDRLAELRAARAAGVPMQSICIMTRDFIGGVTPEQRQAGQAVMRELLDVAGEIGAAGVITPAAYGLHSNRLPPFTPPRPPEEDRAILVEALAALGEHAATRGTEVWLEPLNRYEDHMVNRLAQGVDIVRAVGLPSVGIMADLFHMNIEEADPAQSLRDAGSFVRHIHLADSQRHEPGTGHTDFAAPFAALAEIGYRGVCAIECGLSRDPEASLAAARAALRKAEG
jgi:sugar phosphate isomerase/epimerase